MCKVNDEKIAGYDIDINNLILDFEDEKAKLKDLVESKEELKKLVEESQHSIDYLENCNFGGDKIISSIKTSQKGYIERMAYYDEYIIKCEAAIREIDNDINEKTMLRNSLFRNCGYCDECISLLSDIDVSEGDLGNLENN